MNSIKKETAVMEILNFIKNYGQSFYVDGDDSIVVNTKSGDTKTYYIGSDGSIIGTSLIDNNEE